MKPSLPVAARELYESMISTGSSAEGIPRFAFPAERWRVLRTDLVDVVNQGKAWAFVGSGPSIDSGGPTWGSLLERAVQDLPRDPRSAVESDGGYLEAKVAGDYVKCFSRVQTIGGREALADSVIAQMQALSRPGPVTSILADWPFAGYITTNYDSLISIALTSLKQHGWTEVGNSREEIRKASSDASNVVWHIHGSARLPRAKSRLIISGEDYDDFYLEESPVLAQLKGLLAHRRVVFIGFGFQDPEVVRLLRRVGRLCNPARPAFAFLHGTTLEERDGHLRGTRFTRRIHSIACALGCGSDRCVRPADSACRSPIRLIPRGNERARASDFFACGPWALEQRDRHPIVPERLGSQEIPRRHFHDLSRRRPARAHSARDFWIRGPTALTQVRAEEHN